MSAEALRAFTIDKVNKEASMFVEETMTGREMPLDAIRYNQGFVAGMRRAVELQQEAYRGMDG
jgi:hypothetical protein